MATVYQVAVGTTSRLYETCIDSVGRYCERHGLGHMVQREPILKIRPSPNHGRSKEAVERLGYLPIFEKENAFAHLGEQDVLILDADVYVRDGAPNIFDEVEGDFAGVVEREIPLTPVYRQKIRTYSKMQYNRLKDVDWHWNGDGAEFFNMGVMLCGRSMARLMKGESPRKFLQRKEFQRFVDGIGAWKWSTDQTLLNWWLRSEGATLKRLDWRWNALYGAVQPHRLPEAHFVHFFLKDHLPSKGENVEKLLASIS